MQKLEQQQHEQRERGRGIILKRPNDGASANEASQKQANKEKRPFFHGNFL